MTEGTNDTGGLQRFFDFFKFLGASLTGITAVFSATGFLIERARLTKLGLPSSTFDLEQYLETGARFFAFLPVLLRPLLGYLRQAAYAHTSVYVSEHLPGIVVVLIVLGLAGSAGFVLWRKGARQKTSGSSWFSGREQSGTAPTSQKTSLNRSTRSDHDAEEPARSPVAEPRDEEPLENTLPHSEPSTRGFALRAMRPHVRSSAPIGLFALFALFVVFQLGTVERQTAVLNERDVLFEAPPTTEVAGAEVANPGAHFAGGDFGGTGQAALRSSLHFGRLLLAVIAAGLVLFLVARLGLRRADKFSRPSLWIMKAWLGAGLFFLSAQIVLLPINYGILLDHTRFPEVCVAFSEGGIPRTDLPMDSRLILVHENDDAIYLYSTARRKMWYVRRSTVDNIVYHGLSNVLTDATPQSCSSLE